MKEIIGTVSPYDSRKRGHQEYVTGTGAHIDKKKYTRKIKHKERGSYGCCNTR